MDIFESRLMSSLVERFEAECLRNKVSALPHHSHAAESALVLMLNTLGGAVMLGPDLYRVEGSRVIVHRSVPDVGRAGRPA